MTFAELIEHYWAMLAALLAHVVWLVRLEAKHLSVEKDLKLFSEQRVLDLTRIDAQRREDLLAAKESRGETNTRLGRIEDLLHQLLQKQSVPP